MKVYFRPIVRREFLRKGLAGGVVIASAPLWNPFSCSLLPFSLSESLASNIDISESLISPSFKIAENTIGGQA